MKEIYHFNMCMLLL